MTGTRTTSRKNTMIETGCRTDKGKRRENNEDSFMVFSEQNVFAVSDGVGGSNAGEIASSTVTDGIRAYIEAEPISKCRDEKELGAYLQKCVEVMNGKLFRLAGEDQRRSGMATTLVACYIREQKAYVVNVGDSRAYIRRGSDLFQVTEDHTYVNSLVKLGVITRDEAKVHTKGNVITRAMGAEEDVEPDFYQTDLEDGDIILLCSDGLYGEVDDDNINRIIGEENSMDKLADRLVRAANDAGGRDNITVICLRIGERSTDEQ